MVKVTTPPEGPGVDDVDDAVTVEAKGVAKTVLALELEVAAPPLGAASAVPWSTVTARRKKPVSFIS